MKFDDISVQGEKPKLKYDDVVAQKASLAQPKEKGVVRQFVDNTLEAPLVPAELALTLTTGLLAIFGLGQRNC